MATNQNKTQVLRQMFPGINEQDLAELANVAELRTYPADVILCHEGRVEETFYAIVSGQVEVTKQLDEDTQEVINRPGPGGINRLSVFLQPPSDDTEDFQLVIGNESEIDKHLTDTSNGHISRFPLTVNRSSTHSLSR